MPSFVVWAKQALFAMNGQKVEPIRAWCQTHEVAKSSPIIQVAILLVVLNPASGQSGVPQDVSDEELEDSFLVNPRYRYSFNVVDNDQQVYQDQSQQMLDRVKNLTIIIGPASFLTHFRNLDHRNWKFPNNFRQFILVIHRYDF